MYPHHIQILPTPRHDTTMLVLLLLSVLVVIQATQPQEFKVHLRKGFKRVPKNFQISPSTVKSLLQRSKNLTVVNLFEESVETVIDIGSTRVASSLSYNDTLVAVADRNGPGATAFASETGQAVALAALFRLEKVDSIYSALTTVIDGESSTEAVFFAAADHSKNEVLVEVIPTTTTSVKMVGEDNGVALLFHVVDAQQVAISSQWVVVAQTQFNPHPDDCTKNLTAVNNKLEQTQLVLPTNLCGPITHLAFASDNDLIIRTANGRVVVFDLVGPFQGQVKFDHQIHVDQPVQLGWKSDDNILFTLSLKKGFYIIRSFDGTGKLISVRKLAKADCDCCFDWERVTLAADGTAATILRAPRDKPKQLAVSIYNLPL